MNGVDPLQSALHLGLTSPILSGANKAKKKEDSNEKGSVRKSLFSALLEEKENEDVQLEGLPDEVSGLPFDEAVQVLIDSVYSAGDVLKQKPFADSFVLYKKAVGNFLRFVVSQSYEIEEQEGIRKKTRAGTFTKKKFSIVQVVNQELDRLASDILFNQADQIRMMAKVDEITGLLVDLFS